MTDLALLEELVGALPMLVRADSFNGSPMQISYNNLPVSELAAIVSDLEQYFSGKGVSIQRRIREMETKAGDAFSYSISELVGFVCKFTELVQDSKEYHNKVREAYAASRAYQEKLFNQIHDIVGFSDIERILPQLREEKQRLGMKWIKTKSSQRKIDELCSQIALLEETKNNLSEVDRLRSRTHFPAGMVDVVVSRLKSVTSSKILEAYDHLLGLPDDLLNNLVKSCNPVERYRQSESDYKHTFVQLAHFLCPDEVKGSYRVALGVLQESLPQPLHSEFGLRERMEKVDKPSDFEEYVANELTRKAWDVFASNAQVVKKYGANALEEFERKVSKELWSRIKREECNSAWQASELALSVTPLEQIPYIVMNFWAQERPRQMESFLDTYAADTFASLSEEEVNRLKELGVPGLYEVVTMIRKNQALVSVALAGKIQDDDVESFIRDRDRLDEGLVGMCIHYLENGTPEDKYFALKTAIRLNPLQYSAVSRKGSGTFEEQWRKERDALLPAIGKVLSIPDDKLKDDGFVDKILVEYVGSGYFKYEHIENRTSFDEIKVY